MGCLLVSLGVASRVALALVRTGRGGLAFVLVAAILSPAPDNLGWGLAAAVAAAACAAAVARAVAPADRAEPEAGRAPARD